MNRLCVAVVGLIGVLITFGGERVLAQTVSKELLTSEVLTNPSFLKNRSLSVYTPSEIKRLTSDNARSLITPGAILVERVGGTPTVKVDPLGTRIFRLPYRFRIVGDDLSAKGNYFPEVYPRTALRFHGGQRAYIADLGIGIWEDDPNGPQNLQTSLTLVLGSTTLDTIQPNDLVFRQLNRYQDVSVRAEAPGESPSLTVRPNFDKNGIEVALPLGQRPTMAIFITRDKILGLGLETGVANVQVQNVIEPDGMAISLEIERGWIDGGGEVLLDSTGKGSVSIRSVGVGDATISSRDPAFRTVTTDSVRFTLPWLFGLMILAGSAAGTIATKQSRQVWKRALGSGIAVSAIVVVGYAVGINFLDFTPTAVAGEALTFVIAALGAVGGARVLSRFGT